MTYEIDKFYEFPIIGGIAPSDKHFILEVDVPGGKSQVNLSKLAFQQDPNWKLPDFLTCRVKSLNSDNLPVLSHALSTYVYELY